MTKGYNLRELHKEHGTEAFVRRLIEGVTRKDDPWQLGVSGKHRFSIQELFYALTGQMSPLDGIPLGENENDNLLERIFGQDKSGLREDVAYTAFAMITGNTLQRMFIDAYNEVPRIGPSLADDYPSKLRTETITGFKTMDLPDMEVNAGMPYPDAGFTDKYVTYPEPKKFGAIIRVLKETVHYDQTGQVLDYCQKLAERMATYQEFIDIGQVFDAFYSAGVTGVYYPSGSVAELFPTGGTNNNYVSGATTVLDLTNGVTALRTARNQFKNLVDDSNDAFPILHRPDAILIGDTDVDNVDVLLTSQGDPGSANLRKNPLGNPRHKYTVLSSELVDYFRASATYTRVPTYAWLMGSFKKQYQRKVDFPLQSFVSQGEDKDDAINRDVVFRFKVASKMKIYARDTKHVVFVKGAA